MSEPKVALVVGHNLNSQGAVRVTDRVSEYVWNSAFAEKIQQFSPAHFHIFKRNGRLGSYSREIDDVYDRVDRIGPLFSMELHFNSFANPTAKGNLTLSSGTKGSMAVARKIHGAIQSVMQIEDDGIQIRNKGDRGGRSLWAGRAPAIMLEPYFGSRAESCMVVDAVYDQLAEAVAQAALEYAGVVSPTAPAPAVPVSGGVPVGADFPSESQQDLSEVACHSFATEMRELLDRMQRLSEQMKGWM